MISGPLSPLSSLPNPQGFEVIPSGTPFRTLAGDRANVADTNNESAGVCCLSVAHTPAFAHGSRPPLLIEGIILRWALLFLFSLFLCLSPLSAAPEDITWEKGTYLVYRVDPQTETLRLFWKDNQGLPLKNFSNLRAHCAGEKIDLHFAMNAGIFGRTFAPLGLHVENGQTLVPLNRKRGEGNFFFRPNGVFLLSGNRPFIRETPELQTFKDRIDQATQSGPLLLRRGKIHPGLRADSPHLYTRNGIGIDSRGGIVLVWARTPITLHAFARFFQENRKCPDALYLDGSISSAWHRDHSFVSWSDYAGLIGVVGTGKPATAR